jgi:hypothetical protein
VINIIATIRADLALGQMLAGWTGVVIVLDIVDEVSAREEAAVWVVRGLRLWEPEAAATARPNSWRPE